MINFTVCIMAFLCMAFSTDLMAASLSQEVYELETDARDTAGEWEGN